MSFGCLIRVLASIVDTKPGRVLTTNAVEGHRERAGIADTASETTRTSAPANPSTTTPRTHRNRRIAGPWFAVVIRCPSPATRRDCHPDRLHSDWDITGVLRSGLYVNCRHRPALVGDEGSLAIRCYRHLSGERADRDVIGILRPGFHVDR